MPLFPAGAVTLEAQWDRAFQYQTVAAITAFIYDCLLLFRREISEGIYWKPKRHSTASLLYSILKVMGLVYSIVVYMKHQPGLNKTECVGLDMALSFIRDIGYTTVIKILLILRLYALYHQSRAVSIILWLLITSELVAAMVFFITETILQLNFTDVLQNCILHRHRPFPGVFEVYPRVVLTLWIVRCTVTSLEAFLMLIKLHDALKSVTEGASFWLTISQWQRFTPVLYAFYRDGVLMLIPIFLITILGMVQAIESTRPISDDPLSWVNWPLLLLLVFQCGGSRLILNIRRENSRLTESLLSRQLSSLQFANQGNGQDSPVLDIH